MTSPADRDHGPGTKLRTLLGEYRTTSAIRKRLVQSSELHLEFADVAVPNRAFKRAVRALEFDVTELALMTFLMARSRGVPLYLLPVVIFARNPLPYLICDAERLRLRPSELRGRRIGVRSYTTTTAVWLRALLQDELQVDCDGVEWIALEEGHVAGVSDPPFVVRAPDGSNLTRMLRDAAVDAVIVDPVPPEPRFAPIVQNPEASYRAWQNRHGADTLNHIVAVREPIARDHRLVRALLALFRDGRDLAPTGNREAVPFGLEANRRNLEVAIAVAEAQGLLARRLTVADLVTDAVAVLG